MATIKRSRINEIIREEYEKLIEVKYERTTFDKLSVGDEFFFDVEKDADVWIKNSSKTVKMKQSGRKFQASKNDIVFLRGNVKEAKNTFQQKVDAAKKMIDAGKSEKQVVAKYGQTAFNAVNAQNEYK